MQIWIQVLDSSRTETTLVEPEVFTSFDVQIDVPTHLWLHPDDIAALAGELGQDAAWRQKLTGMARYAATQGWTDDEGRIRAHVTGARA